MRAKPHEVAGPVSSRGFLTTGHVAGPPATSAPVALLLHGFTQNRHCWGDFARSLGAGTTGGARSVWAMDLPGHGSSGHDDADFALAAKLVGQTIRALPFAIDLIIGYSMGGRLALAASLDQTEPLATPLALIGATAGLADAEERAARRLADADLAYRLRSEGPEAFLDFWLKLPLFAGLTDAQQHRTERLAHWGSGVAETLERRGTGSMDPLWDRLEELAVPTLVIAGQDDAKFVDLGQRLAAAVGPNASFAQIPRAGHACHLQEPTAVATVVADWAH